MFDVAAASSKQNCEGGKGNVVFSNFREGEGIKGGAISIIHSGWCRKRKLTIGHLGSNIGKFLLFVNSK
eukprot:scaffold34624_cov205-Skeletonema_dohrnii-CCMP3373.AAC.4